MCGHCGWGPWLSASCPAVRARRAYAVCGAHRAAPGDDGTGSRVSCPTSPARSSKARPRTKTASAISAPTGTWLCRSAPCQSVSLICRVCVNHRPVAASIANDLLRACEQLPDGWVAAARAALDDEDVDTAARFLDTVGGRGSVLGRPFASDPTRCCVMALFCALLV